MVDSASSLARTKASNPSTLSCTNSQAISKPGTGQPMGAVGRRILCACAVLCTAACTIVAEIDRTKIPGPPPENSPAGNGPEGDAGTAPVDAGGTPDATVDTDAAIEDAGAPQPQDDAGLPLDASTVDPNDGSDAGLDAS